MKKGLGAFAIGVKAYPLSTIPRFPQHDPIAEPGKQLGYGEQQSGFGGDNEFGAAFFTCFKDRGGDFFRRDLADPHARAGSPGLFG